MKFVGLHASIPRIPFPDAMRDSHLVKADSAITDKLCGEIILEFKYV